jgi:hypothetical protein
MMFSSKKYNYKIPTFRKKNVKNSQNVGIFSFIISHLEDTLTQLSV